MDNALVGHTNKHPHALSQTTFVVYAFLVSLSICKVPVGQILAQIVHPTHFDLFTFTVYATGITSGSKVSIQTINLYVNTKI